MKRDPKPLATGLSVSALLLMLTAGSSLATIPSTADHRNATEPMITGTVLVANPHEMRVATEQGGEVQLTVDSRSVVPATLARDMMVRVEFHDMDNGSRHVERVIPIRRGDRTTRELAYSHEREGDPMTARNASNEPSARDHEGLRETDETVDAEKTIPGTHAYAVATTPMVAGRVTRVNDERILVDTENGGQVALRMDSRTLLPSRLESGMGVRIDFVAMENGEYLARRITEDGSYAGQSKNLTYESSAEPARQGDVDAVPASYRDSESRGGSNAEAAASRDRDGATDRNRSTDQGQLPRTASGEPWIALSGIGALAAAGALALRRRYAG